MESMQTPRARILVIGMEGGLAASLSDALGQHGHQLTRVSTGREALARIEAKGADLVVLDFGVPDVEALELLRRSKELMPGSPVLMTAASPSVEAAVEALRRGAYDFLVAPVDPIDFVRRVDSALNVRRLGEARRRTAEELQHEKVRNLEMRRDLQAR
ncbi:MAG TPA: response regulator, partial [Candidatus Polarisedimenticolia bacterium]|nr:response regulator [Candidatus Polarisedimenticolia bacterium]